MSLKICSLCILIFLFYTGLRSQDIENVEATYSNDTLVITYDLSGEVYLDSLQIELSSVYTGKVYTFTFQGDASTEIVPGPGKKAWTILTRDSFPDQGESLNIRLITWEQQDVEFKHKGPVDPRFYFSSTAGIIFRSSAFPRIGNKLSLSLNYRPVHNFQIGFGMEYYYFLNDDKTEYETVPAFITSRYYLPGIFSNVFTLLNCGYSFENRGSVLSMGLGYKDIIIGPLGVDVSIQTHRFSGFYDFYATSLNVGFSFSGFSRGSMKTDSVHRFLIYTETGLNYYRKVMPSLSFDIVYNISSFYSQGIGLSYENINYRLQSTENSNDIIDHHVPPLGEESTGDILELKIKMIPVYLTGRLFFFSGKLRPYINWRYGFTLFSSVDKGKIKNGFVGDLGAGLQFPLNDRLNMTLSSGIKYFDNKFADKGFVNQEFNIFFFRAGIAF